MGGDLEMLHIIPQWFSVDGQDNIRYPVGMVGTRLEAQVHIITVSQTSLQNVNRCFDRINMNVNQTYLQNLATSRAVLTSEEKELGVLMIDIGSDTTNISVYKKQSPIYTKVYQKFGGHLITNDISIGLKIANVVAEDIKIKYGVADLEYADDVEEIELPAFGGRTRKVIERKTLAMIIKPRIFEIFKIIREDLEMNGMFEELNGGVVIAGGTANIVGIDTVCQEVFNLPSRVGYIKKLQGLGDQIIDPEYAVVNGLIYLGHEKHFSEERNYERRGKRDGQSSSVLGSFRDFFSKFF